MGKSRDGYPCTGYNCSCCISIVYAISATATRDIEYRRMAKILVPTVSGLFLDEMRWDDEVVGYRYEANNPSMIVGDRNLAAHRPGVKFLAITKSRYLRKFQHVVRKRRSYGQKGEPSRRTEKRKCTTWTRGKTGNREDWSLCSEDYLYMR